MADFEILKLAPIVSNDTDVHSEIGHEARPIFE
jgi:hypothetical protein